MQETGVSHQSVVTVKQTSSDLTTDLITSLKSRSKSLKSNMKSQSTSLKSSIEPIRPSHKQDANHPNCELRL